MIIKSVSYFRAGTLNFRNVHTCVYRVYKIMENTMIHKRMMNIVKSEKDIKTLILTDSQDYLN